MGDDGATYGPDIEGAATGCGGDRRPSPGRDTSSPDHGATPLTGAALRAALRAELPSLLRTATRYLGDPVAAEELTRRTLQECVGPTHRLTRDGIRLTLHLWLRALAVADRAPQPSIERCGRQDLVAAAVERLPDDVRAAVHLVDSEGFDYHETAQILGIPTSTATSLIHAGRDLVAATVWRADRVHRSEDGA